MSESFAELLEQSEIARKMNLGSIISAKVLDIDRDMVIVDAGLKSEGFIPVAQFHNEKGEIEISVGDEVDVSLDAIEDGFGEARFSREKAKRAVVWKALEEAYAENGLVTGTVSEKIKGGFIVDIDGLKAFLPGSLTDVRPIKELAEFGSKTMSLKIIKIDQRRNNIVVSRRAAMDITQAEEQSDIFETLNEGDVVKGTVKNMTEYGAFVDLGGIDGLLHITDMAWKRVKTPSDVVTPGEEVEVKVLRLDQERKRISLGLKQLGEDPWAGVVNSYPEGMQLRGVVTNLTEYGCFVEIEEGVEGLVHISEMDWVNKNVRPSKLVQIGEEVDVAVIDVDTEKRRISLGMKQCQPNPWKEFAAVHKRGDQISGVIRSLTDFGLFVGIDGSNIDGLVHISDISWFGDGEELLRQGHFKKGQVVNAVVLTIDAKRERISLGLKQIEKDPFSVYISDHPKGSNVTGVVSGVDKRSATVELAKGVNGHLKAAELSRDEKIEDLRTALKAGEEIEAKITYVDHKKRSVHLSVKARLNEDEKIALQEYGATADEEAPRKSSLGDLIREKIGR